MVGKGNGGPVNYTPQNFFAGVPFADILATSLMNPLFPGPSAQALDFMEKGRPSYNWAAMGALAPLAGFIPQPEYRSAPPSPLLQDWAKAGPYYIDSSGNITRDKIGDKGGSFGWLFG